MFFVKILSQVTCLKNSILQIGNKVLARPYMEDASQDLGVSITWNVEYNSIWPKCSINRKLTTGRIQGLVGVRSKTFLLGWFHIWIFQYEVSYHSIDSSCVQSDGNCVCQFSRLKCSDFGPSVVEDGWIYLQYFLQFKECNHVICHYSDLKWDLKISYKGPFTLDYKDLQGQSIIWRC